MKHEVLCDVSYYFENVPFLIRKIALEKFIEHYNEAVDIYNDHIDEVNRKWDQTGIYDAFGDDGEGLNPEYLEFIRNEIQPAIDVLNKQFLICKYRINDIGIIEGYLPLLRKSKIYFKIDKIVSKEA